MKWYHILIFLLPACGQKNGSEQGDIAGKFNLAWQSNAPELVLKIREELARSAVKSPEVLYARAWLADRAGDGPQALKTADSLVMGYPQFEKGWYLRANLKEKSGDLEAAIQDYDKALKRNPAFAEALINRGSLQFKTRHYDLALKDFEKARSIVPQNKLVAINLGNAWMAFGKPEKACQFWKTADSMGYPGADTLLKKYCSP